MPAVGSTGSRCSSTSRPSTRSRRGAHGDARCTRSRRGNKTVRRARQRGRHCAGRWRPGDRDRTVRPAASGIATHRPQRTHRGDRHNWGPRPTGSRCPGHPAGFCVVLLIRRLTIAATMTTMTEPHRAVISRLSADFAAMSRQLARVSADLTELDRLLSAPRPVTPPQPAPYVPPAVPYWPQYPPPAPRVHIPPTPVPPKPPRDRSEGWIGKLLAVAGVAV